MYVVNVEHSERSERAKMSLNDRDYNNETNLIRAVICNNSLEVKRLMMQPNIDISVQGFLTGTALTYAIFKEQFEIAKIILENAKYPIGDHPGALHWAIIGKNKEIIRLLVEKGVDINMRSGLQGYITYDHVWKPYPEQEDTPFHRDYIGELKLTPLCLAINLDDIELTDFLIRECHADPNLSAKQLSFITIGGVEYKTALADIARQ